MIWTNNLDPVALDLGFAQIRWYGVFYAIAFLFAFSWLKIAARKKLIDFSAREIEDLIFGIIVGVIVGGRLGYFLFYDFDQLFSLEIFKIWHGGMSFHGGLVGVVLAVFYFARRFQKPFFEIADAVVVPAAVGLFFGRLGNFVNSELVGRATNSSWGVVFPSFDDTPRLPSQLFEAAKNLGIAGILFLILRQKPRAGILTFAFLFFYGVGRTAVEIFWREPLDGFIFGMPRGAVFSLPLIFVGIAGISWLKFSRRG